MGGRGRGGGGAFQLGNSIIILPGALLHNAKERCAKGRDRRVQREPREARETLHSLLASQKQKQFLY